MGSSIGITIAKNRKELEQAIKIALNFDKKIIVEQIVDNLREINCSVIGTTNSCTASVLEEPKNWKTFLDFDEKYILAGKDNKKVIDVKLEQNLEERIKELSCNVFKTLGCCGIARIDFLMNDKTKEIYVNEINTIPGSFANYLWRHKYSFSQLLDKLIENAHTEYLFKNKYTYAHKSKVLENYKQGSKIKKIAK